jgi:hypothetical protein
VSRPLRASLFCGAIAACLIVPAGAAAAPTNDNRGAAWALSGTSANLTHVNDEATTEPGEDLNCNGAPFDSTVWYRYDPPAAGTAVYSVAGGVQYTGDGSDPVNGDDLRLDTVIQLYDAGGGLQTCNDDAGNGFQSQVSSFYAANNPAPVLLQVGGYDYGPFTEFEWGEFTLNLNFSPATRVAANLKYRYQRFKNYLRLTKASVSAESGSTIEIDCKGSCGFKGEKEFARSPVNLQKLLPRRLNFGTTIDIFVTEPNRFGYYARLKIKPKPKKTARCLGAGVLEAERDDISACPAG